MIEILTAKNLARILPLILCPCLLCDSPSELQKAQDLLAKGSLPEVVTVSRKVVRDDPGNPDAHLLLGTALALCRIGKWREGIAQLHEVLREDPDNADAAKALLIAQEEVAKKIGDADRTEMSPCR